MSNLPAGKQIATKDTQFIDEVIARRAGSPGFLLGVLEEIQAHSPKKYICRDTLRYVALKTNTPLSQMFSVITFYALFNQAPQGEHTISICRGTACHTRGSRDLLETVRLELGLHEDAEGQQADKLTLTTADGQFTIRTVACFGQCAMAPVVELDHRICGHMNERVLTREVEEIAHERLA
jgi:NADH-quinone oxidoreductase subunit E